MIVCLFQIDPKLAFPRRAHPKVCFQKHDWLISSDLWQLWEALLQKNSFLKVILSSNMKHHPQFICRWSHGQRRYSLEVSLHLAHWRTWRITSNSSERYLCWFIHQSLFMLYNDSGFLLHCGRGTGTWIQEDCELSCSTCPSCWAGEACCCWRVGEQFVGA